MTYPKHIRHLLGRSTTAIQGLTLSIWVATLLLNPYLQRPWPPGNALLLAALLGAVASTLLVRRFWQWRMSGALYVLLLSWAYQVELRQMGTHGEFWWLPTTVTLCLGINLLFPFTRDYLLALAYTWTIMLIGQPLPLAADRDPILLGLLVVAVSLIGLAMNRTFARSMLITYRLKEDYRRISETDVLTGLANRRALMAQLHARAAERGERGTLHFAMLDIDDFKQVNDTYGHDVGDAVLRALATELTRLEQGCAVGRLGGEEFGILLDGMSDTQTLALLQRLLERVRRIRAKGVAFTFSAGVARLHPDGDVSALLKRADRALYAAKRDGKSRICLDSGMPPAMATLQHAPTARRRMPDSGGQAAGIGFPLRADTSPQTRTRRSCAPRRGIALRGYTARHSRRRPNALISTALSRSSGRRARIHQRRGAGADNAPATSANQAASMAKASSGSATYSVGSRCAGSSAANRPANTSAVCGLPSWVNTPMTKAERTAGICCSCAAADVGAGVRHARQASQSR